MAIKKNRAVLNEERNKRIKDMDMEEVRHYLCMKNNQNPDKCEGCLGLSSCTAGQRVMVLKAEQKQRAAEEQKETALKKKHNYGTSRLERGRTYAKQVLAAENPSEYLMQNEGITLKQALKKLENWRMRYRDLFDDANPKTQNEENTNAVAEFKNERRVQFETACQQEQMTQWMMGQTGMDRQRARARLKYLARTFPDVAEKYHFNQKFEAEADWSTVHITPEEKEQKMENDDVSVEDFLTAMNADEAQKEEVQAPATGEGMLGAMQSKLDELAGQRDEMLIAIHDLEDKVAGIQNTIDAIRTTARVFGLELE